MTPGVQFHDGTPYTAHDTAFTYERNGGSAEYHQGGETTDHPAGWATARRTFGPPAAWESHEVIDDLTLRINVGRPSASLPGSVLSKAVWHLSKEYIERVGDEEADRAPMGTGPYRYVSDTDDTEFIHERNDDYFRSRPGEAAGGRALNYEASPGRYLPWTKRLEGLVRPEPLSAVAGVEAGEIDIAQQLSPDLVRPYQNNEDFQVKFSAAGAGTSHEIMPNTHLAEWNGEPNPFLDIRVRLAADYAIDRQTYIDNLLSGEETAYFGKFEGVFGFPSLDVWEGIQRSYDLEKAKQLMVEAGYPDGFDTTLHIVTDFVPVIPTLALVIQQDLAAIGIRTEIKEYPSSEYFVEIRKFEQPGLWWFFTNTIPEPETVLGSTTAQGFYNVTPLPETRIFELYQQQEETLDPALRNEILAELYIEAYSQAQFIYLHNALEAALMREFVDWDLTKTQGYHQTYLYAAKILNT